MACFSIENVRIAGLTATVPAGRVSNLDLPMLSERERKLLVKTTGIRERRIAAPEVCASDLCANAAERLLHSLGWTPESIDVLVFVSQTPDYSVPGSAAQLQSRLGLATSAMAIDINQGCAGYVYGLAALAGLQSSTRLRRGLLLVGDTITRILSEQDKSTVPIFSDAGSATALEWQQDAAPMHFNLQSDGKGHKAIIVPEGGARKPLDAQSMELQSGGEGIARAGIHMAMQGLDIFNFALREVAPNIRALLEYAGTAADTVDQFVFHQANRLLNESIRKKLGLPPEKVPYSLESYGNTSCATIPVTLVAALAPALQNAPQHLLLSGFGVGLSWGSAILRTDQLICPEMNEYPA